MGINDLKKAFRKIWHFIWEEDSVLSWTVNIILAFILIKFVVYPLLGLVFMTSHPIVAVVSGSMEHDGSFDDWWASQARCDGYKVCSQGEWYSKSGISEEAFEEYSFKNGFNTGDIIVLVGTKPDEIEIGDVMVFWADPQYRQNYPIIHRVVEKKSASQGLIFKTKGDHNIDSGPLDTEIPENMVVGRAVFRIPYLGWIKIGVFKGLEWIGVFKLIAYVRG